MKKPATLAGIVGIALILSACTGNTPKPKGGKEYSEDFSACLEIVEKRLQSPESGCIDAGSHFDRLYLTWDCMVEEKGWGEDDIGRYRENIENIKG